VLETQLALAKRNKWPLTVGFVDIDTLKVVNDSHGHIVGDDLIVSISEILKNNLRQSDTISRIGGDESLIIFPLCTLEEAEELWKRIEESIYAFNQTMDKPYMISVSHGFAEYVPGEEISAQELVEIADSKMYQVKKPEA